MKYSDDCKVYRIRYYNVWFYLFAKTEMDEYKINILGERIGMGDSMMMKDIHCWCTRQNIRYRTKFKYRKDYPILANIWNLYSYCRFRCDLKRYDPQMYSMASYARYLFRELEFNIDDPAFATFDFQGYGERQLGLLESVQTTYGMITRNEDFPIQTQQNTEQGMKMQ